MATRGNLISGILLCWGHLSRHLSHAAYCHRRLAIASNPRLPTEVHAPHCTAAVRTPAAACWWAKASRAALAAE